MDKDIKKDKLNIKDKDVDGLKEYNSNISAKPFYIDNRTDESYFNTISTDDTYFESTNNRRPSYPWEDEFIKDKPLTTEQQKEYDSQYNTEERFYQGETSKKIVKRTAKYKSTKDAFNLELNPNIQRTPSVGNPRPRAIRYDNFSKNVIYNESPLISPTVPMAASPANPGAKAKDIQIIKSDSGYSRWKNQIESNGGDKWLGALYDECVSIGCNFRDMLFVLSKESGFKPTAKNRSSGASGLIQWMPPYKSFRNRGISSPLQLNAFEQLPFITLYYKGRGGYEQYGVPNLVACYTYVAGGNTTDPNRIIYRRGTKAYSSNTSWDLNKDGNITGGEIALSSVAAWYGKKDWKTLYPDGIWKTWRLF